jgi:hypothetical protein
MVMKMKPRGKSKTEKKCFKKEKLKRQGGGDDRRDTAVTFKEERKR